MQRKINFSINAAEMKREDFFPFFSVTKISRLKPLSQVVADLVEVNLEPSLVCNGQEHIVGPLAFI